jgi:glycosyltransferase involved in cell wall biosynthesis
MDVTHRKGWDVLLRSYVREFQNQTDVALIFKGYFGGVSDNQKRSLIYRLKDFVAKLGVKKPPNIIFFGDVLDNDMLPRLYKLAHCFVLPHRGEGWSLCLSEAMSMEVPSIGTGWSGNTEFMDQSNSYLIDVIDFREINEEMSKITPNYKGHKWAEPSEAHLRQLMRRVYDHYDEAKKKAKKGRQDLIKNFSWKPVTDKIKEAIKDLNNKYKKGVTEL